MAPFALLSEVAPGRPGSEPGKPAVGPTYRASYAADGAPSLEGVNSLGDMFRQSAAKFPSEPCLGHRPIVEGKAQPYEYLTYQEVVEAVDLVGSGYRALGLEPKQTVSVFGPNCPEWMIVMQGINRMNLACVPLYDTLGETVIEYIINHAEVRLVVVSAPKLALLAKALPKLDKPLLAIVHYGGASQDDIQSISSSGTRVLSLEELKALGAAKPVPPEDVGLTDLATVMYTSGTTGDPKGVKLSHRALLAHIASVNLFLAEIGIQVDHNDSFLSFLPLAHAFDRLVEEFVISRGGRICYYQGDPRHIMDDLVAAQPTIFCAVPRVLERVYSGVMAKVAKGSALARAVFNYSYQRKLTMMNYGWRHDKASLISDWLVFHKIKQALGGNVRVILSGAAPLAPHVETWLKVVMCAPVVQGYGLTETCAASFIAQPFKDEQSGTVGPPMPVTELRLEAVPEMNYDPFADPPRGEVCIAGPGVYDGYLKNEELTKESTDADGFFHSGDIGELTKDGALRIIDRKKNIFKLSQGEYVAVEKLEIEYSKCDAVDQVWVYGNSFESVLVAVVVPKKSVLTNWAQQAGVGGTYDELVKLPAAAKWVLEQLTATGKASKLKGFEAIKAVHLDAVRFSMENDLLTPTFKIKRAQLLKHYKKEVDALYAAVNAAFAKKK